MFTPDYSIDLDWLHRISFHLERFSKASGSRSTYQARCVLCGDSQKSSRKARLYFYTKGGGLNVHCKNCNYSHSFYTFMKDAFPAEFEQYKKDQLLERFKPASERRSTPIGVSDQPNDENAVELKIERLNGTVPISSLRSDHPAIEYLRGRCFGPKQTSRLLYADDFVDVIDELNPSMNTEKMRHEPRIVIPFYSTDGKIEMVQGRSLDPSSKLKYMSVKAHDDVDKVYGKYELDRSKTTYCVEGPFDSLFVDNCVATCDSSLTRADADVYIWDNQPRNKEVVDLINDAITRGKSVVIWPWSPNTKEDINDMIKSGMTTDQLMAMIKERTFSGLRAKLEVSKWKRV